MIDRNSRGYIDKPFKGYLQTGEHSGYQTSDGYGAETAPKPKQWHVRKQTKTRGERTLITSSARCTLLRGEFMTVMI